eukprot:14770013-Heterocapsa_arctica.AAC.1
MHVCTIISVKGFLCQRRLERLPSEVQDRSALDGERGCRSLSSDADAIPGTIAPVGDGLALQMQELMDLALRARVA